VAISTEERVSYIEGKMESLATKADLGKVSEQVANLGVQVAEMRGELRAMRWSIAVVGVGISIVILATRLIG
jgi:hypothetical protein